jgi:hypothetical protein
VSLNEVSIEIVSPVASFAVNAFELHHVQFSLYLPLEELLSILSRIIEDTSFARGQRIERGRLTFHRLKRLFTLNWLFKGSRSLE